MRNPYEILGLKPNADQAEIRKAFRKLAKQYHPDLNPGNKAAESTFKEVNAAYDLLSDPLKRGRFDRGEIDAEGREAHAFAEAGGFDPSRAGRWRSAGPGQGFSFSVGGGAGEDVGDLFAKMFGQGGFGASAPRGRDLRQSVRVEFVEAVNGATRRLTLPGGRQLDVTIPAGVENGQVLRLKGQGDFGLGGQKGDLLLEIQVAPHSRFVRQGDDIRMDLPISLMEAVAGGRITVPTPSGRVSVTIPEGANSGQVLRLKGKGVAGRGDLYLTLQVTLPKPIDADLAALVRQWGDAHRYDPRAGW